MSAAALFKRGLIDFTVMQFRQQVCMYVCMSECMSDCQLSCVSVCVCQVEAARFRPALDPQNKQRMHGLALAMGAEDPLRGEARVG